MTEVLLLSTFHFEQCNLDFGARAAQNELIDLCRRLVAFAPDAVAVEKNASWQVEIDRIYSLINNETLAQGNWNESYQIGGRLAKMLRLPKLYGINYPLELDEPTPEDYEIIRKRSDLIQAAVHKQQGILDLHRLYNSAWYIGQDANIYLDLNACNEDGSYRRSRFFAQWYERNLGIFSNLQQLAEGHEKIFVVYGAGHYTILKQLIDCSEKMRFISPEIYLG